MTDLDALDGDSFDPLPAIGLPDLVGSAGLLTRMDRKYLVRAELVTELAAALSGFQLLTIDDRTSFGYESVYFDTFELLSYTGAATGRRRRFKVRTRIYLDSDLCFLEVKTRGRRGTTVKVRCPHPLNASLELGPNVPFLEEALQGRVGSADLHPLLRTRYQRLTLANPAQNERITIDRSISAELIAHQRSVGLGSWVVIETKSGSAATAVDRWLWAQGIRPSRVSKFATTLAMLEPKLSSNKWHRAIQRVSA